jgi:multidrug efflux system membrane fusion protein
VQKPEVLAPAPTGVGRIGIGRWLLGGGALIAVLTTFAYMNRVGPGAAQRGPRSTAAPVRVAVAERRDVAVVERTIGTVLANTAVQVTARVQGVIDAAHFQEGQFVKTGDLLFQIDPRPYQAALAQAKAQLAKDEAQLENAANNEKRLRAVYEQKLTSVEQLDAAVAATGSASASVAADRAAIDLAQLNLDYTRIRAPIDGKTGPILVQPGNVVATNATQQPLVTINQIQPIKVSFSLPQSDLPRIQARASAGGLVATVDQRGAGGGEYSAPVDFVSNHVDDASGTIELRATFANADSSLVPGQLVDVTVELGGIAAATVVPREAVNSGPDGLYAYVVTADNRAEQRVVKVLFDDGTADAIAGDVRPGDQVIVDGQLRVVPGAAVYVDNPERKQAAVAESP